MLVLGNEDWGSSSYARSSYIGPMDWFKKASGFDNEYLSLIQWRLNFLSFFMLMDLKKYQPHYHMNMQ